MLQSTGLQRVRYDWATELNWQVKCGQINSMKFLMAGGEGVIIMWGAPTLAGFSSWKPIRFSQGRLEKAPPCGGGWGWETSGTAKSLSLILHTEQKAKSAGERERTSKPCSRGALPQWGNRLEVYKIRTLIQREKHFKTTASWPKCLPPRVGEKEQQSKEKWGRERQPIPRGRTGALMRTTPLVYDSQYLPNIKD